MHLKRSHRDSVTDDRDRPAKRHSSSPLPSPLNSNPIMPAPLEVSQKLLDECAYDNYTYFDNQTDSGSSTPQRAPLSSQMDTLSSQVDMDDASHLEPSPTPHAATDAHSEEIPLHLRKREDSGASKTTFDFAKFDLPTRAKHYELLFSDQVIPLKQLQAPPACQQFTDLAEEIFNNYLLQATFTIDVWANYDSITGKLFLEENRIADCGKVCLPPKKRAWLERFSDQLQFSNVKFRIGTPFRTLAEMDITVLFDEGRIDRLDVGAKLIPDIRGREQALVTSMVPDFQWNNGERRNQKHPLIAWLVKRARDECRATPVETWQGKEGLLLEDLDRIAELMVCLPKTRQDEYNYFDG